MSTNVAFHCRCKKKKQDLYYDRKMITTVDKCVFGDRFLRVKFHDTELIKHKKTKIHCTISKVYVSIMLTPPARLPSSS